MTLQGFVEVAKSYLVEGRGVPAFWAQDITQCQLERLDPREFDAMLTEIDAFAATFNK